jgi:hypothetical protein
VAVLAFVSSVALVGCGDNGTISISKEDTSTTVADDTGDDSGDASGDDREALITYVLGEENPLGDEAAGECVADAILDQLSPDALDTVRTGGDFALSPFSEEDAALIVGALDECIDLEDAVATFAEGIASEDSLPLSEDEARCAATEFAAEYTGAGEFIAAVGAMDEDESGERLFTALGPCMTDESAVTFMSTLLVEQGMTDELATCVAQGIVDRLGAASLLEAIASSATGGDSSALEAASEEAGADCASEGLGDGGGSVTIPPIGGGLSGN